MKMRAVFGCFLRYPSAGVIFVMYLLLVIYKNYAWLWGEIN